MRQRLHNPRTFLLVGASQQAAAQTFLANLPLDADEPLEVVVRERVKPRKMSQNALMWVGPLADIAEQAWVHGKRFTAEAWHEHFKREFLPEEFDPELCLDGYVKWQITPRGDRALVGSTTMLTVKGMAQYLQQVEAAGAELGVEFRARGAADAAPLRTQAQDAHVEGVDTPVEVHIQAPRAEEARRPRTEVPGRLPGRALLPADPGRMPW